MYSYAPFLSVKWIRINKLTMYQMWNCQWLLVVSPTQLSVNATPCKCNFLYEGWAVGIQNFEIWWKPIFLTFSQLNWSKQLKLLQILKTWCRAGLKTIFPGPQGGGGVAVKFRKIMLLIVISSDLSPFWVWCLQMLVKNSTIYLPCLKKPNVCLNLIIFGQIWVKF